MEPTAAPAEPSAVDRLREARRSESASVTGGSTVLTTGEPSAVDRLRDAHEDGHQVESYGRHVSTALDSITRQAKTDASLAEQLPATRQGLADFFQYNNVGQLEAGNLASRAGVFLRGQPRTSAEIEVMNHETTAAIRKEFGAKTEQVLSAARQLAQDLMRRAPMTRQAIDAGLGSDREFVRSCIAIAQKKKMF